MVRRPLKTDETEKSRRRTRQHKSKEGEERKSTGSISVQRISEADSLFIGRVCNKKQSD